MNFTRPAGYRDLANCYHKISENSPGSLSSGPLLTFSLNFASIAVDFDEFFPSANIAPKLSIKLYLFIVFPISNVWQEKKPKYEDELLSDKPQL